MRKNLVFTACGLSLLISLIYMLFVEYIDGIPTSFWSNLYYMNDKLLLCILVAHNIRFQYSSIELAMSILFIMFQIMLIIFIFATSNAYVENYFWGFGLSIVIFFIYLVLTYIKYLR